MVLDVSSDILVLMSGSSAHEEERSAGCSSKISEFLAILQLRKSEPQMHLRFWTPVSSLRALRQDALAPGALLPDVFC